MRQKVLPYSFLFHAKARKLFIERERATSSMESENVNQSQVSHFHQHQFHLFESLFAFWFCDVIYADPFFKSGYFAIIYHGRSTLKLCNGKKQLSVRSLAGFVCVFFFTLLLFTRSPSLRYGNLSKREREKHAIKNYFKRNINKNYAHES